MPITGLEVVVGAPPLVAAPTGLLPSAQVIERDLLEAVGDLSRMVGPDAPDTILAPEQGALEEGGEFADPMSHWASGLRWSPESNLTPELVDPCTDVGTAMSTLHASGGTGVSRVPQVLADPFLVVLHDSCSTFGWEQDDYVGRAQRGLAARETVMVEREFMHGTLMGRSRTVADAVTATSTALVSATIGFTQADVGKPVTGTGAHAADIAAGTRIASVTNATTAVLNQATLGTHTGVSVVLGSLAGGTNRYLSDQNVNIWSMGATDPTPIQALAYASEAIARWGGGQGMIHVSAFFAEVVSALGYTFARDARGRLVTLNGNIVVPGNGYDGVGPDGTGGSADDGANDSGHSHEWIYVSDLPVIWRSKAPMIFPKDLREATNMALNEVTYRAERPYIIEWSALLQVAIKCNVLG